MGERNTAIEGQPRIQHAICAGVGRRHLTGTKYLLPTLTLTVKNRFGIPKNRTALPLHLRTVTSFAWTECPFALTRAVRNPGRHTVSGVDFLVAYWMARRYLWDVDLPTGRDQDASDPSVGPVPET